MVGVGLVGWPVWGALAWDESACSGCLGPFSFRTRLTLVTVSLSLEDPQSCTHPRRLVG